MMIQMKTPQVCWHTHCSNVSCLVNWNKYIYILLVFFICKCITRLIALTKSVSPLVYIVINNTCCPPVIGPAYLQSIKLQSPLAAHVKIVTKRRSCSREPNTHHHLGTGILQSMPLDGFPNKCVSHGVTFNEVFGHKWTTFDISKLFNVVLVGSQPYKAHCIIFCT